MSVPRGLADGGEVNDEFLASIDAEPFVDGGLVIREERAGAEAEGGGGEEGILAGVAGLHRDHAVGGEGIFPLRAVGCGSPNQHGCRARDGAFAVAGGEEFFGRFWIFIDNDQGMCRRLVAIDAGFESTTKTSPMEDFR